MQRGPRLKVTQEKRRSWAGLTERGKTQDFVIIWLFTLSDDALMYNAVNRAWSPGIPTCRQAAIPVNLTGAPFYTHALFLNYFFIPVLVGWEELWEENPPSLLSFSPSPALCSDNPRQGSCHQVPTIHADTHASCQELRGMQRRGCPVRTFTSARKRGKPQQGTRTLGRSWTRWPPGGPSNPSYPIIPWNSDNIRINL